MLECIFLFTLILVYYIYTQLHAEHAVITDVKRRIAVVLPSVSELYIRQGEKPMIVNKQDIYLTLYDSDGRLYDINTIVYVCLHELSHLICDTEDTVEHHSPAFYSIFNKRLRVSVDNGVFNPTTPINSDFM